MAEDRANHPNRRFVTHKTTKYKLTRPGAEVGFSTQKVTMHHDGSHVVMPGPSTLSAKGNASHVSDMLNIIKEAHRPTEEK
jgi:hypothetical protein